MPNMCQATFLGITETQATTVGFLLLIFMGT